MPIVTDNYTLSLTQDNRVLRVRCSQNDTSRQVNFTIYNNGTLFTIPTGLSVSVHGIKQNGNIFTKSCSYSGSVVTLVLGTQITDTVGISVAELVFTNSSGGKIGTSNFIFQVESDPLLRGTIDVTEETPTEYISDLISMVESLSARVNNIVAPEGEASLSEVVDARSSNYSGTIYQNLKLRLDTDFAALNDTKADKSDTYTISGVDNEINNDTQNLISNDFDIDSTFSIGGVNTSTGKSNTVQTRVRLSYMRLNQFGAYRARIENDNYYILNAWLYSDSNEDAAIRNITEYVKSGKYINFKLLSEDELYIRITFRHAVGDDKMTNKDVEEIASSFNLYEFTDIELSKKGIPADGFSTGVALSNTNEKIDDLYNLLHKIESVMSSYVIDWKKFKQDASPVGWGIGYYNVYTGDGNSSSTNYIRTRNRLDIDLISENTIMCSVTPPTGYYVLVCVTNKSDNSFVQTLNTDRIVDKTIYFEFDKTKRYGFTIGLFDGDSESYVNEQFLNSIKLTIFEKAKSDNNYQPADLTRTYIWDSNLEYALMLPANYSPIGKTTKLIICGHGLSSTIDANSWGAKNVSSKFVEQGYAVMDVNKVTSQDWCNPALIKKYIIALNDIVNKYNVIPIFVFGFSMGSLIGLTLSTIIPGIKANVISGIRLDFLARYNEATQEEQAIINTNLGFTDGFDYNKISGWCKTAYAYLTSNNELVNPVSLPPTLFLWGTSDTLTQSESLEKIEELKRGGSICDVISYEGGTHGAMCLLSAGTSFDDALDWLETWG